MSVDDDFYYGGAAGEFEFSLQRRGPQSSTFHVGGAGGRSMHGSTSLQVCYVNDVAADLDRDPASSSVTAAAAGSSTTAAAQRPHPKPDVIPKSISEVSDWLSSTAEGGGVIFRDGKESEPSKNEPEAEPRFCQEPNQTRNRTQTWFLLGSFTK